MKITNIPQKDVKDQQLVSFLLLLNIMESGGKVSVNLRYPEASDNKACVLMACITLTEGTKIFLSCLFHVLFTRIRYFKLVIKSF